MSPLNDYVKEYTMQLQKGEIQRAYQGIMSFMSSLRAYLAATHTDYLISALYFGYMDMTYFAFTPSLLRDKKLKIALVYLHEDCRFDIWLSANNKNLQAVYHNSLKDLPLGAYTLSPIAPGIDSIIESILIEHPDFDCPEKLTKQIEEGALNFIDHVISLLSIADV